ncbi:similar to Saccharomyces cerevisiae YDR363W ESC2 Sumo-like domain protein [Maudiozyma saulgeensis]|uniref:Similar to Saccharomyces cerevisiae YDR363W ESC2 Sumo-like domain protein n=1 Tax=Maudiozyma saulgeensis TaxID=1789683 RepID=A0A1X7R1Y7_9SACH|nr:similar to Saccharomyces cerevisiae YDR363W ESC2 Sumo-like domain protein [Kazachstania saulgeensis]
MSDSEDDDDFFKASSSEDEEDLRNHIEDIIIESSKPNNNNNNNNNNNIKDDAFNLFSEPKKDDIKQNKSNSDEEHVVLEDRSSSNGSNNLKRTSDSDSMNTEKKSDFENSRRKRARTRLRNKEPISIDDDDDEQDSFSEISSRVSSPQKNDTTNRKDNYSDSDDENDLFFKELSRKKSPPTLEAPIPTSEAKRLYTIRFISKLDGSINKSVRVKVLGKFTFAKILPSALQGLQKAYKIPAVMKKIYQADNVALYWNSTKVLDFMTCNSLNIKQSFENEISNIDITIVSKEMEKSMELSLRAERQEADAKEAAEKAQSNGSRDKTNSIKTSLDDNQSADLIIEEFERELHDIALPNVIENSNTSNDRTLDPSDDTKEEIMKISLVGNDNKKIFVNVRGGTILSKLTDYYRKQKKLPQNTNFELYFDDEKLDLSMTIGSYDIEDEDMIEVKVLN